VNGHSGLGPKCLARTAQQRAGALRTRPNRIPEHHGARPPWPSSPCRAASRTVFPAKASREVMPAGIWSFRFSRPPNRRSCSRPIRLVRWVRCGHGVLGRASPKEPHLVGRARGDPWTHRHRDPASRATRPVRELRCADDRLVDDLRLVRRERLGRRRDGAGDHRGPREAPASPQAGAGRGTGHFRPDAPYGH
jgi:hypothetical protein